MRDTRELRQLLIVAVASAIGAIVGEKVKKGLTK